MIIYLAGKITGDPDYRAKFAEAKAKLEAEGHIVLNPAELPEGMSKAAYMRICFAMIDTADELRAVPGWVDSDVALLEIDYCLYIKKPAAYVNGYKIGGAE